MPRTAPVMASEAPGNFLTGALWNANVKALGDFLTGPPLFFGYQASSQSIPNNTFTSATLDTEIVDTDGGHSTVSNTSRYVFQVPGTYHVEGAGVFATNTTGFRAVKFFKNGGTAVVGSEQSAAPVSGFGTTCLTSGLVVAAVGDYVEVQLYQSSGGALSTTSNGSFEYVTFMRVQWISL